MKVRVPWHIVVLVALTCITAGAASLARAQSDPPGRVARLNDFNGTVTYAPAGTDNWVYAHRNRPLTSGDAVWVDRGSRAEMHIGGTAVRLGPETSARLLAVTDQNVQLNVTQGTLSLRLRRVDPNQPYEIDTPNLAFVPQQAGVYRLDVDPAGVTTVTVWQGYGTIYGEGTSLPIAQGQRLRLAGTNLLQQPLTGPIEVDAFDDWGRARDAREDASVSARYVPRDMTGFESLDDYGTWEDTASYGTVWVPSETPDDWAPYRTGHWAWIAPWGWTWVDEAPWGFAPYHYGRWAYLNARWCWVPGPVAVRPVYAPALVGWVGGSSGNNGWSVALAAGGAGVAWFPLGPHDPYRPAYHTSSAYITQINRSTVISTTNINVQNNIQNNVFVNRSVRNAVTAVPAGAFVQGRPVREVRSELANPRQGQPAWHVGNSPGVAPVRQSLIGAARPAQVVPPREAFERPVLATRAPQGPQGPSRELTSGLRPVQGAGGQPLRFDQAPGRGPARNGGNAPQGRLAPQVTVVGTGGAPRGAGPQGVPATPGTPREPGVPGTPRVPGSPGVRESGVPHPPASQMPQDVGRPGPGPGDGRAPQRFESRPQGGQAPVNPNDVPRPTRVPSQVERPQTPPPQMERPQAPRPQPQFERPQMPPPQMERPQAPRPQPQVERPQPQPQMERPQPPRPQPQPQMERPQPPRPQPQPQMERPQQPRPQPQPQMERPQPPRPQPQPQMERPQPQMERPQPAPRQQPQERPHPQPNEAPRQDALPHGQLHGPDAARAHLSADGRAARETRS
ncbi:Putative prolin-rich exported protein [Pandoraea terrae]|uniref:Prolin-rich exported protein n=1 Tax=Pandoraea terrae TaxID=1537710 RepID=A0A5E4ZAL8_9BURK|nr:DUF6600 domain-containing protein [Pandoraea terrae]VVE57213.1 Putative prolin-rich exported protein [Pandoraea terrae]